jgi:hypothetical protein
MPSGIPPTMLETLKTLSELVAFLAGSIWALYKIREFRELKHRIGFEVEADIYPLSSPVTASRPTWNVKREQEFLAPELQTHAIEIRASFDNRGNRRFRLYNLQLAVNTMRLPAETKFDPDVGYVSLRRVHTSGNVVPEMKVGDLPPEETSFFYIEPGVKQTISYVTLLSQPAELIQVVGEFSLEQRRIFPKARIGPMRLIPHTASKTYRFPSNEG